MQSLKTPSGTVHLQEDKEREVMKHFEGILGQAAERTETLDWKLLNLQSHNLESLEEEFTEDEIREVVMEMHSEKSSWARWLYWQILQKLLGGDQV